MNFLDRVHISEMKLREEGLWEVPHPWLNLLIPKSKIHEFAREVFGNILTDTSHGPILIYPLNKSKYHGFIELTLPFLLLFIIIFGCNLNILLISGGKMGHHWSLLRRMFSTL